MRYIIEYRKEFSTVVEAETLNEAIVKVVEKPYGYQWECVGGLHLAFLQLAVDGVD